ncbi:Usher syndrome type-1C protein-binding protein 1 [Varanus komodoensis]|uniref:Usher syndrome type-1C protein-binding protein 1 n=1 Tax=Varanus komodoensis TaxID=61221 RepID=UPI001CF7E47A|nr:Usher syndrome type-1C protein-binding protein 1 [Varanus komodoensis]
MQKSEVGPPDGGFQETVPDEQAVLRYEEHITDLLVTVARLHRQIERLQDSKASREDEDFSDLCSEYTASLPQCRPQFSRLAAAIPALPPRPACSREGKADLFLDVHKAVTSLENTLLSHRSRMSSAEANMAGCALGTEGQKESLQKFQGPWPWLDQEADGVGLGMDEMSIYKQEIAMQKEKNASLWKDLEGMNQALSCSKATLSAYQKERDKLLKKVQELQSTLSKRETPTDGAASPARERALWEPQQGPPPAETLAKCKDMEAQGQQLRGCIEKWRCANQLLLAALQESKSDAEHISMLLGSCEANNTALCLAAQYSECRLEAYETLFSLTVAGLHLPLEAAAEEAGPPVGEPSNSRCAVKSTVKDEVCQAFQSSRLDHEAPGGCTQPEQGLPGARGSAEEERKALLGRIAWLRAEQASVKLPAHWPPLRPDSATASINAGIRARVAEVQRTLRDELLPEATQPKMEKAHLLQGLQAAREGLADLNTQLHLMEKDKQALELWTYTHRAREASCLLMIQILQGERDELRGQQSASSESSSSSSSSESCLGEYAPLCSPRQTVPGSPKGRRSSAEPQVWMRDCLDALARNRELKDQVFSLLIDLEERSQDCRAQETQQMELTSKFFKAHRALVLAYWNARKKREAQVRQLEMQISQMSQRQAGQLQSLMQTLQQLEDRASSLA